MKPFIKRKIGANGGTLSSDMPITPIIASSIHDKNIDSDPKTFQENVMANIKNVEPLICLENMEQPGNKAKTKTAKTRRLMECPDCHQEVKSNNMALHQERHVKQLNAKKSYSYRCQLCNFKTNRKSVLTSHALVHDPAHQLAKLVRKNQRKKQTKLSAGQRKSAEQTAKEVREATQTEQQLSGQIEAKMSTEATQTDQQLSGQTVANKSTQTDQQLSNVQIKMLTVRQILQIHYALLAKAPPNQVDTFIDIFDAMIQPLNEIFTVLSSLYKESAIDRAVVATVGLDFSEIVGEMIKKRAEVLKEEDVRFVAAGKVTYVPDTNAFIAHHDIVETIMKAAKKESCYVAVPQTVKSELDGLKKNSNLHIAHAARKGLRLLVAYKNHLIAEPYLQYMKDATLYADMNMPGHDRSDNSIVNYSCKLAKNKKHSVIMVTDDMCVLTKYEGTAITPETYMNRIARIKREALDT